MDSRDSWESRERLLSKKAQLSSPRDEYRPDLFALEDGLQFMTLAASALCQDEFSKCFEPKPVKHSPTFSLRSIFYIIGVLIRYGVLFPIRLSILLIGSIFFCAALPFVSGNPSAGQTIFLWFCKIWLLSISAWVRHHGPKPRPSCPHIFVANHTSFIDFFLMSSHEFCHATVAQVHGGLFGFLQRHVLRLNGSLFFYRDEAKDREKLAKRMRAHTESWKTQSPLIIFPEGTCVNNEYTVLFHKGAFELGCVVCPVAIKYNKRLLDPYWNTREQSFAQHLFYLMTRWFMIADVWWLPPDKLREDEISIDFAGRIKKQISRAAGLKNLSWDGYMKNYLRQQDQDRLQKSNQMKYGAMLRKKLPTLIGPEVVQAEIQKAEQNEADRVANLSTSVNITRDRAKRARSVVQDVLDGPTLRTLTDVRNEILVSSPVRPDKEHVDRKDRLARSWKHHSVLMKMAEDGDQTESRLEYTSWRLWSKHHQQQTKKNGEIRGDFNESRAFEGRNEDTTEDTAEDANSKRDSMKEDNVEDSVNTGIALDD